MRYHLFLYLALKDSENSQNMKLVTHRMDKLNVGSVTYDFFSRRIERKPKIGAMLYSSSNTSNVKLHIWYTTLFEIMYKLV